MSQMDLWLPAGGGRRSRTSATASRSRHRHIGSPLDAEAMSIAWEQVAYWYPRTTLRELQAVIGQRGSWEDVANKLADLWLSLQQRNNIVQIPVIHRDVDGIALTARKAA